MATKSYPFLKAILKAIKECIIIADNDSKIFYVNSEFTRTFGYEFNEVQEKSLDMLFCNPYHETGTTPLDWFGTQLSQGLIGKKSQMEVVHKRGFTFNVNIKLIESKNEMGEQYFILSLHPNAANRTLAGDANLKSDDLEQLHLEQMGSWEWDLTNDRGNWSAELYDILGLSNNQIEGNFWNYFDYVYPPDKKFVTKTVLEALKERKSFKLIHRIVKEDGKIAIVQVVGATLKGEADEVTSMLGTLNDISDELERVRRITILSKVFEHSKEAIVITDEENKIAETNNAFSEITGFDAHEVEGKNPGFLKSGKHDKNFYQAMWSAITSEGAWEGEVWDRRKSGEIYPKYLAISTFMDDTTGKIRYLGVFSDTSKEKKEVERLKNLAFFDALTGLCNRSYLIELLSEELKFCHRNQLPLSVCFLDLDNFKQINDNHGHAAGDQMLCNAGELMKSHFRESDIVSRFGGDEFVLILKGIQDEQALDKLLTEFLNKVPSLSEEWDIPVNCSIGVSRYPKDGATAEELLQKSDLAMYEAKAQGKGRFTVYHPELKNHCKLKE